jgi:hypothetical protein
MMDKLKQAWDEGWFAAGSVGAAFLYMLNLSWLKWGDLIVDTGREMYVPLRLARGAVLYKDIFYLYGPFSPYFHAFLFKMSDEHLSALIFSGILTAGLTTLLIYKTSRFFLNRFFSTLAALIFVTVCAFGHYLLLTNYNFIIPYSYPAIHALLFSLAALYFFFCFCRSLENPHLLLSAAAAFLALITRIEMGLMLLITLSAGWALMRFSRPKPCVRPCQSALLLGTPVLLSAIVYGGFWLAASEELLKSSIFSILSSNTLMDNPFTAWLSGKDAPLQNMIIMFKTFFYYGLLTAWFILAGTAIRWSEGFINPCLRRSLYAGIALLFMGSALLFLGQVFPFDLQYRALPIFLIMTIGISFFHFLKGKNRVRESMIITLSIFSLLILLRILLLVHPMHYGFSLLAPGLIAYHIMFFRQLPGFFHSKMIRRSIQAGFTGVFLFFSAQHMMTSRHAYGYHTLKFDSPRGSMRLLHTDKNAGCTELILSLLKNTAPEDTVTVLPEGVAINFLAERNSPLYYYSFLPPDLKSPGVETAIIDDIEKTRVDYLVLVQRETKEYGADAFGADYAQNLWAHIEKNYTLVHQVGNFPYTSPQFGAAVYQRNPVRP